MSQGKHAYEWGKVMWNSVISEPVQFEFSGSEKSEIWGKNQKDIIPMRYYTDFNDNFWCEILKWLVYSDPGGKYLHFDTEFQWGS